MIRTSKMMILLLVVTTFTAIGCTDPKLTALQNDLMIANKQLDALGVTNARLTSENEELNRQLQSARNEIRGLENDLVAYQDGGITIDVAEGWDRGASGDRLLISSDVLFSSGSATLSAKGKAALDRAARDLKGNYAGLPIRVFGYTDSDPIKQSSKQWTDNLDLSANRAMAVTRHLISKGLNADNIESIAMGTTHPVASNGTKSGKAENRRVEIVVIR
mgnify:CR=1 FL=1